MAKWHSTACILCECNCGIEVQLGDDERSFQRIRGDKKHPASKGYACEKPSRLNFYQNNRDRLKSPLRRREDGSFEEIDWDTAINEIASRLAGVRDTHGGESIFYYGGGGQGNHLPGAYSQATRAALGSRYRSNALAQEKTGEAWVNGKMFGAIVRGDFERCEVGVFIGKNPWQSHSIPRARVTLREIAKDAKRSLIVIDPRRSESAELADEHLAVKPGRDAWLLGAILACIIEEDLVDHEWVNQHCEGFVEIASLLGEISVPRFAEIAGISEEQVRRVARRIATAKSVAFFEDLGVQMNLHSTLVSYLNRLLWSVTGNFSKRGAQYIPTSLISLMGNSASTGEKKTPVSGAKIIAGLVPCNVIAEEILSDHPKRYRAMLVESANPAHSLADSPKMRRALKALDCLVVIDVAMTETAKFADYVLPVSTQYEKCEATFFNFEFPENYFHLRKPILDPPQGVLTEAEIHSRVVESLGEVPKDQLETLKAAAVEGRAAFGTAFFQLMNDEPALMRVAPILLYRSLGETLPAGMEAAAALWAASQLCAMANGDAIRRAGFLGEGLALGDALFDAFLESDTAVVFSKDEYAGSWQRVGTPDRKIQLAIPELEEELRSLQEGDHSHTSSEFPFVLSAGERRSFTANTIFRDPSWRKKDAGGTLRISPADAEQLGISTGDRITLHTKNGKAAVAVEISDRMQDGHISLPNGHGLTYPGKTGESETIGVAPNELTASEDRDSIAGTPWHKHVPARIEV